jgi:hypothetical protein
MPRVTLIPSHLMTLFGPRIAIYTKDGQHYTKQSTGREFMWDFDDRHAGFATSSQAYRSRRRSSRASSRPAATSTDKLMRLTLQQA